MIDRRPFDCVFNPPDGVLGWWMCVSEDGLSDNTPSQRASRPPSSESATTQLHFGASHTHSPAQPCEDGCCRRLATANKPGWDLTGFQTFSSLFPPNWSDKCDRTRPLQPVRGPQGDSRNRRSEAGVPWNPAVEHLSVSGGHVGTCLQPKTGKSRGPVCCWRSNLLAGVLFLQQAADNRGGGANPPQSTKITVVLSAINHPSAAFQTLCSFTSGADDVAVKKNYILNQ